MRSISRFLVPCLDLNFLIPIFGDSVNACAFSVCGSVNVLLIERKVSSFEFESLCLCVYVCVDIADRKWRQQRPELRDGTEDA